MAYTTRDERKARRQVDRFLNGKIDSLYDGIENPVDREYLREYFEKKSYQIETGLRDNLARRKSNEHSFAEDLRGLAIPLALGGLLLGLHQTGNQENGRDISDFLYIGMMTIFAGSLAYVAADDLPKNNIKKVEKKIKRLELALQQTS